MTGLLLIAISIAWLVATALAARWAAARFRSPVVKTMVWLLAFPSLLIAPMTDELIGSRQFAALCKRYAVQAIDEAHIANSRVSFERRSGDRFAEGTAVRIRIDPYTYRDADTKRVLVTFNILTAEGGWLSRLLGVSETTAPLLFNTGCSPPDPFAFQKRFNVTVID